LVAEALIKGIATVLGLAVAWVLLFDLNEYAFSNLERSSRANWVFLPAAFRIIFVLLFSRLGALGLFCGAYLTLPDSIYSFPFDNVAFAAVSGIAPLAAVYLVRRCISLADDLSGLRGVHIVVLSVVCAAVNSIVLNIVIALTPDGYFDVTQIATVFIGDMLGGAIVLTVISVTTVLISRLRRARTYT
jgi:hypothetical protein